MCYSKEVQFITAMAIFISVSFFYIYYSIKYKKSKKKWLKPFLNNITLVFLFIGGHQFFEFLSIVTNNQFIYKTGLLSSILGGYFAVRTVEVLLNKNLHSKILLWAIGILAIINAFTPMHFESYKFYIRHYSVYYWAMLWAFIAVYLLIVTILEIRKFKDDSSRKTLILAIFAIGGVSIALSILYYVFGYFYFAVNSCYDFTSIWCTFYVVQVFFIPFFLTSLHYIFERPKKKTMLSWKRTITYTIITLIILVILRLIHPSACFFRKVAFS